MAPFVTRRFWYPAGGRSGARDRVLPVQGDKLALAHGGLERETHNRKKPRIPGLAARAAFGTVLAAVQRRSRALVFGGDFTSQTGLCTWMPH